MRKPYLELIKLEVKVIQEALAVWKQSSYGDIENPYEFDRLWERFWLSKDIDEGVRVSLAKQSMIAAFLAYGGKVYKIAEEFGKELEKVDLNIPNKFIPDKQFMCIELPDSVVIMHSGIRITTIFVMYDSTPNGRKLLSVEAAGEFKDPLKHRYTFRSRYDLSNPEETILDALNRNKVSKTYMYLNWKDGVEKSGVEDTSNDTEVEFEETLTLYKYLIKCLVYIGSGDPDLREYRAPKCDRKSEKKRKNWERKHSDQSLIDMVFVGFDFKKERVYKSDDIWIETFPRWQRYGENLRYVKLIWVKPHPRHYKKEG